MKRCQCISLCLVLFLTLWSGALMRVEGVPTQVREQIVSRVYAPRQSRSLREHVDANNLAFVPLSVRESVTPEDVLGYAAVSVFPKDEQDATRIGDLMASLGAFETCEGDLDALRYDGERTCIFVSESQLAALEALQPPADLEVVLHSLAELFLDSAVKSHSNQMDGLGRQGNPSDEQEESSETTEEPVDANGTSSVSPESSPEPLPQSTDENGTFYASSFYDTYRDLDDVYKHMEELVELYPEVLSLVTLGASSSGRPIYAFRVGRTSSSSPVRGVMTGLQHAREWIAVSSVIYVAEVLCLQYTKKTDKAIVALLDNVELVLVPIVNPDGYVHTFERNRFWRKNRRAVDLDSPCTGVDLNRNYPVGFGGVSTSSNDICSSLFRGTEAFSEPETQAIRSLLEGERGIAFYVDVHSYGQLVLAPYAYKFDRADDESLYTFADTIASAMTARYGLNYTSGPASTTLYRAAGISIDYSYGALGLMSVGIELRPRTYSATDGFVLESRYIRPSGMELFDGTMRAVRFSADARGLVYPGGPNQPNMPNVTDDGSNDGSNVGAACFAADSMVRVREPSSGLVMTKRLDELEEGDLVESFGTENAATTQFERLVLLQHRDDHFAVRVPMLVVHFWDTENGGTGQLTGTPHHMVYTRRHGKPALATIGELAQGDQLVSAAGHVLHVLSVKDAGVTRAVNALVWNQNIVVNGVRASCHPRVFVWLSKDSSAALAALLVMPLKILASLRWCGAVRWVDRLVTKAGSLATV
ncbi:Carboxypeptidase A1 [Porphyridium purpureum]|uniref:Carboxypeptidase A1 n=1 Tax=Porphyridium purpureum TaxID=35688 RepID=A0A5J4Z3X6_PORPP|nr:Carboxypeptidase A1 [Porphyridium purpureum]|eukprot:POR6656..scf295_1